MIGIGHAYDGWVEIDAYGWRPESDSAGERRQVCVWTETKSLPDPNYGSCFGASELSKPIAIEGSAQVLGPKRLRSHLISGSLSPEVARVALTFKRGDGRSERVEATVAQVSGRLMRQLHQEAPFGYFFAKVRGTIPLKKVRAIAYAENGSKIGSTRGLTAHVITVE